MKRKLVKMNPNDYDVTLHNYYKRVNEFYAKHGPAGGAGKTDITVVHDDWCGVYEDCYCNCNPVVRWGTPNPNQPKL